MSVKYFFHYQDKWELFFQELCSNLSHTEIEAWASDIEPENFTKAYVTLAGLNQFFCDHIKTTHKNLIKNLLSKHFADHLNQDFDLILRVKKKKIKINEEKLSDFQALSKKSGLNLNNCFENFVNGSNTDIAYAASKSVAENIEKTRYNPLFICGDVGLGKTHLTQSIGVYVLKKQPNKKILYCTSENFTNEVIEGIRFGKTKSIREKYRNLDVLLIDDIQFLENKESTKEEFFHTFNELVTNNKQVILTADRYPREIKQIEERLRSRFSSGMVAKIDSPDFETRVAIIKNIIAKHGEINITEEVILHIAHAVKSNVRDIKGVILKLDAEYNLLQQEITLDTARIILKETLNLDKSPKTVAEVIKLVSKKMNVKTSDIISEKRDREISMARQMAMYISREVTDLSYPVIGRSFEKNHTSVIQSFKKIKILIEENAEIKQTVESIIRELTTS